MPSRSRWLGRVFAESATSLSLFMCGDVVLRSVRPVAYPRARMHAISLQRPRALKILENASRAASAQLRAASLSKRVCSGAYLCAVAPHPTHRGASHASCSYAACAQSSRRGAGRMRSRAEEQRRLQLGAGRLHGHRHLELPRRRWTSSRKRRRPTRSERPAATGEQ